MVALGSMKDDSFGAVAPPGCGVRKIKVTKSSRDRIREMGRRRLASALPELGCFIVSPSGWVREQKGQIPVAREEVLVIANPDGRSKARVI
jgi:hypothetical protein